MSNLVKGTDGRGSSVLIDQRFDRSQAVPAITGPRPTVMSRELFYPVLTAVYFARVAAFNHGHTIMHSGLAKNTIEMILDRSFRQAKPRRNLLAVPAG
jgi:hypothetical protein